MSLRSFHIFFIAVAALLACGVGYMEYVNWQEVGRTIHLVGCCASGVAAVALLVYDVVFYRKTRNLVT